MPACCADSASLHSRPVRFYLLKNMNGVFRGKNAIFADPPISITTTVPRRQNHTITTANGRSSPGCHCHGQRGTVGTFSPW